MSRLTIVQPLPIASVIASRGTGANNLSTFDPKEVWADITPDGFAATLSIDLGAARSIDTIFLGFLRPATDAIWAISGGVAGPNEIVLQGAAAMRVLDLPGQDVRYDHALWTGPAQTARYLNIPVAQPGGAAALSIGVLVIGKAFAAELGQEWGDGRQPIDLGTATELPSGGFSVVEGARKLRYSWTFGDLSQAEADQLEQLSLALGTTAPGLVIEDADRTPGLRSRIHYGLFEAWKQFERRNRRQTRWEVGIRQWI